jgi:putative SOS response-associated peptidase YedK
MIVTEPNEFAAKIHDRMPVRVQTLALPHSDVRLLRVAEHPERKAAVVFHAAPSASAFELLTRFETGQRCRKSAAVEEGPHDLAVLIS